MSEPFGLALRDLREQAGLSLRALAERAHCSHSHIADLEAGRRRPGAAVAESLDAVLSASGRLVQLADCVEGATFRVRSHKFVAGFIGSTVNKLAAELGGERIERHAPVFEEWIVPVEHPTGKANLHLWGHGATIVHIVEEADWCDIASLAQWRYTTYERDLEWVERELIGAVRSPYVLSFYWVLEPAWTGERLERALRLICCPRTLVGQNPSQGVASGVEETLLREGFPHADGVVGFGTTDVAVGYASWSGVVYHPIDVTRALYEQELVDVELTTQSAWQYCSWIADEVEAGRDPEVPGQYGWRWLRAARSRLLTARPQETNPHRTMREAVMTTSGIPGMLENAIATLRELS